MTTTRRSLSSVVGKRGALMPMVSASANAIELSTIPEPSMVSTSAHSILPLYAGSSNPGHPQPDHRAPSPPASSYFPSVSDTQTGEPQPTPGASTHFAYSTTLRRHHGEGLLSLHAPKLSDITPGVTAEGLWQKAVSAVTGQRVQDDALEGGYSLVGGRTTAPLPHHEDKKDTASARFAHWSVEVRNHIFDCYFLFVVRGITWLIPAVWGSSPGVLYRTLGIPNPTF
jgi:Ca2+-transporting ATPase